MNTPPVTLGGLWSGFDVEGTINKLMKLELGQVQKVQDRKTQVQAKQKAWQDINTSLSTLRSSLDPLRLMGTFTARTATFDIADVATASVISGTTLGVHSLVVSQLATSHTVQGSSTVTDPNAVLALTDLNGTAVTPDSFTITVGGTTKTINVSAADTLNSLRDTIRSQAGDLVQADVTKVMNGGTATYKLVMSSKTSGASGGITMSDSGSGLLMSLGLQSRYTASSALKADPAAALSWGPGSFDITVGGVVTTISVATTDSLNSLAATIQTQAGTLVQATVKSVTSGGTTSYQLVLTSKTGSAITLTDTASPGLLATMGMTTGGGTINTSIGAQDAKFTIDNTSYQTASNTANDALLGVNLTLKKAGSTNLTVGQDSGTTSKTVQSWVDALNASLKLLRDATAYDSNTKNAGILQSEPLANDLYFNLKGMLSTIVSGMGTNDPKSLADVGVTTGAWGSQDYGKVLFDSTKLTSRLGQDETAVAKLFGALRQNLALPSNNPAVTFSDNGNAGANYAPSGAFNGILDNTRFGTPGGGWMSATVPTTASPATLQVNLGSVKTVDSLQLYLMPKTATTGGLKDFTVDYSKDGVTWTTISNVTGNDKDFRSFDFQPVNAQYFRVNVTATNSFTAPDNGQAKILELTVNAYSNAPARAMFSSVSASLTSNTGPIAIRGSYYDTQVKDMDTRMAKMVSDMQTHEQRLRLQFSNMERAIARIQTQGSGLMAQMMGAPTR